MSTVRRSSRLAALPPKPPLQLEESSDEKEAPPRRSSRKPKTTLDLDTSKTTCDNIRKDLEVDKLLEELMASLEINVSREDMQPKRKQHDLTTHIAYYLTGPIGAGKSYWYHELFEERNIPHHLYNVDKYQEYLLKINNVLKGTKEYTSISNKLMSISTKCAREDLGYYNENGEAVVGLLTKDLETIVIDKPADSFDIIKLNFYNLLKNMNYTQQYMIYVYRSLEDTIKGNEGRDRTLPRFVVEKSWKKSIANIEELQKLFNTNPDGTITKRFFIIHGNKNNTEKSIMLGKTEIVFDTIEDVKQMLEKNHPLTGGSKKKRRSKKQYTS